MKLPTNTYTDRGGDCKKCNLAVSYVYSHMWVFILLCARLELTLLVQKITQNF